MSENEIHAARSSTVARLKTLINQELKEICRQERLGVTGVKAQLQSRITQYMEDAISRRDMATFERVRYRVMHNGASPPPTDSTNSTTYSGGMGMNINLNGSYSSHSRPSLPPPLPRSSHSATPSRLSFKPSPFYHILENLSRVTDLVEMPNNRHSVPVSLPLSENVCEQLKSDPNLRIMLYCTSPSILSQYEIADISFPGQIEVKMNQEDVKSNYKGLKNKPGTTKPADLTPYVRKTPRYANNLQINYALTSKKYSFVVNLVRKSTAEELSEKIRNGKVISKDSVLRDMINKARDPDIEATSSKMSLKDPVSTMRMEIPCRSTICAHNQCFDALCFVQLQEQAPTWTCPICNKHIPYEMLAVDQYVLDILSKTSRSVEQVIVEPEGAWREVKEENNDQPGTQTRASYDDDYSDDDLVEITDPTSYGGVPIKKDTTAPSMTPNLGLGQHMTPPLSSREASVAQTASSGRNKRPSAVIDLTLSDDDEPPRPAKRQTTAHPPGPSYLPNGGGDSHRPTLYTGFAQHINSPQSPPSGHGPSPRPTEQRQAWSNGYTSSYGSPWPQYQSR